MRVIFDAGPQRWKIWFVVAITLLTGAGLVCIGAYMLQTYGLAPDDGGVLKPLRNRILVSLAFGVPGLAIVAGILLYLRCYVTRIEADEAGDGFRVKLAGPGRTLAFGIGDVAGTSYNDGVSNAGGISVNAPWYSLRLRGRRFPLIVDLQGDFLDKRAIDRLIDGEPAPAVIEKPKRKPRDNRRRPR